MRLINQNEYGFTDLRRQHLWQVPERFNMAAAVCDRHVWKRDAVALFSETKNGTRNQYTFSQLKELSNKFSNVLKSMGVAEGDRIAVVLPQRIETGICHLATWKIGAISLPLSVLFGTDALRYRLKDSGSCTVISAGQPLEKIYEVIPDLPDLKHIINCDGGPNNFWDLLKQASSNFAPNQTFADDPALIIYTSGTTGPPKGAVLAHRCLLGNLTGFEMSHNFFPKDSDLMWTPADWAWAGGLLDALLPSWYYGYPVLGYAGGRFDAERACHMMARYRVRNAFIPPTALKMMRQIGDLRAIGVSLRSVMSAGETLGSHLYEWALEALGVNVNEMFGQTECNYVVGNCSAIMPVRPGSMGKPYPGHCVEPMDTEGSIMPDGEVGELCVHRNDPTMFLGYWNGEEDTQEKMRGEWWKTGDVGYRDADGYLWFVGRQDDVISSAGHRIGPGEIEDSILKHTAVLQVAVVGSPDDLRGEIVKAFIVLSEGISGTEELKSDIQNFVRSTLAAHEYPRQIEFLSKLPLTTTGKVRRVELRSREKRIET